MSVALSVELYALLLEWHEMATSQIAALESGLDPSDPRRLAVLQQMLVDLSRIIKPEQAALN